MARIEIRGHALGVHLYYELIGDNGQRIAQLNGLAYDTVLKQTIAIGGVVQDGDILRLYNTVLEGTDNLNGLNADTAVTIFTGTNGQVHRALQVVEEFMRYINAVSDELPYTPVTLLSEGYYNSNSAAAAIGKILERYLPAEGFDTEALSNEFSFPNNLNNPGGSKDILKGQTWSPIFSADGATIVGSHVVGVSGSDYMNGASGNDILIGMGGNDRLGNDPENLSTDGKNTIYGGSETNKVLYDTTDGIDQYSFITDTGLKRILHVYDNYQTLETTGDSSDTDTLYSIEEMFAKTFSGENTVTFGKVHTSPVQIKDATETELNGLKAQNDFLTTVVRVNDVATLGNFGTFIGTELDDGFTLREVLARKFDGHDGVDTVSYEDITDNAGMTIRLKDETAFVTGSDLVAGPGLGGPYDILSHIENAKGSQFGDIITGDGAINELSGLGGNDLFHADAGGDRFIGGDGIDTLDYTAQDQHEILTNGTGYGLKIIADMEKGVIERTLISGGKKAVDYIRSADDVIERIIGASGDDVFKGKAGTVNTFFNGAGQQVNTRGDMADFSDYAAGTSVNVTLGGAGTDSAGGTYTLTNIEQVVGTQSSDTITGDGNVNWLFGNTGADTINGGGGNDHIIGGSGNDILEGGAGSDTYYFSLNGQAPLWVSGGFDTITDTSGLDTVYLLGGYIFAPSSFTPSGQSLSISGAANITTSTDIEFVTYSDTAKFSMARLSALQTSGTAGTVDGSTLLGDALANNLVAGAGITTVQGQGGNDWLSGGIGVTLEGGSGEDYLSGAGTLNGGSDNDYLEGAAAGNVIYRTSGGIDVIKDVGVGGNLMDAPAYTLWKADNGSLIIDFSGANDSAGVIASTHKVIALNHFSGIANNKLEMINGAVVPIVNVQVLTTVLDDVIAGTSGNDSFVAGEGEDFADLGGGANTFTFNPTDTASTTITSLVDAQVDLLVFNNFTQSDVSLVRDASVGTNNLLFSYGQSYVVLQNAVLDQSYANHYNVQFGNNVPVTFAFLDLTTRGSYTDDTLIGDVYGFSPDDIIYAGAGNDIIEGRLGDDMLYGEEGDDDIDGGDGEDSIDGGAGDDTITTGNGSDYVIDSAGDDIYTLSRGDRILMGAGHNTIDFEGVGSASAGDPLGTFIVEFAPSISQSDISVTRDIENDDIIKVSYGAYSVDIAAQVNPILDLSDAYASISTFSLETRGTGAGEEITDMIYVEYDSVLGGYVRANITQDDVIYGEGGDDEIVVFNGGNDEVYGGSGNDTIGQGEIPGFPITGFVKFYGEEGDDLLATNTLAGELYGGAGNDELISLDMSDRLDGGDGNDWISAGNGDDLVFGGAGNDLITGLLGGSKAVDGGAGNDLIIFDSAGDDIIEGGDGLDTLSFENLFGFGTQINLSSQTAIISGVTYNFSGIEGAIGTSGTDTIIGTSGNNFLDGGADLIASFANDSLQGGAGNDTYFFGSVFNPRTPPSAGGSLPPTAPVIGNDVISDSSGDDDYIQFSDYFRLSDLSFAQSGNDMLISFAGGSVRIQNHFGSGKIENLRLADGSILDMDYYNSWILGTSGVDTMTATGAGQDLYGLADDDIMSAFDTGSSLHGGLGDDTLYGNITTDILNGGVGDDDIYGGAGDDLYIFSPGDGFDTITETSGFDSLKITQSVMMSDLEFTQSGNDLFIQIASGVTIKDFYAGDSNKILEQLIFDDGIVFDLTTLLNQAPIAQDDFFTGLQDTQIFGNLLADNGNGADSDPDAGDTLSILAQTLTTAHGSVIISANGDFTYNPTAGYVGTDSFDYTLLDALAETDTASVSLSLLSNADTFTATSASENFDGGAGVDTVDYSASVLAVNIDLQNAVFSGGDAQGDTLISIENIIGSNGASVRDWIWGDTNDNEIYGKDGADILEGGSGADTIDGGAGWDYSRYTRSATGVTVNLLTNVNTGGDAQGDILSNIEAIVGSNYNDHITGGNGSDYLKGENGHDYLDGGLGDDQLFGVEGNDTYYYGFGRDTVHEQGSGIDRVVFDASRLPMGAVITGNKIIFTAGVDELTFNNINLFEIFSFNGYADMSLAELIALNSGITDLGTSGDDILLGTSAAQSFDGMAGNDTVDYSASVAGVKLDLVAGTGTEGDAAGDSYISIENSIGSNSASVRDWVWGDANDNEIYGMAGDDILEGGAGADTIDGGAGWDYARYLRSDAGVNINLETGVNTGGHAQGDVLIGIEAIVGSNYNDTLRGGNGNDYLKGEGGNDILAGGLGVDQLYGGAGADIFLFESASAFSNIEKVMDFNLSQNDKIDLSDLLSGYNPLSQAITDFVRITDSGANSILAIDSNGGADNFVQIATLYSVTGLTDEAALETSGNLITV